ncbi:MAG: adenylate kinase [Armatimonadetes bacterium]|nr:adenylate kinase [Armatimonadota bacterium]
MEPRALRVVLLGPPGAGKGTQASQICRGWRVPHISTGDILREHCRRGTDLGRQAQSFMAEGRLVPDSLILGMLRQRLENHDTARGFLLDGFPRTTIQAESLEAYLQEVDRPLLRVLQLKLEDETIVRRLSLRRTCIRCGRIYHLEQNAPRVADRCDHDGQTLEQRTDDREAVIRTRLQVYHEQTAPLVSFYAQRDLLSEVDAALPIQEIQGRIARLLTSCLRPLRSTRRASAGSVRRSLQI